jgi:putative heme-binding domain-containing protein
MRLAFSAIPFVAAFSLISSVSMAAPAPRSSAVRPSTFQLRPGDHVCLIGNALAERMQHFGWLETYLHARYPGYELVFRNLGYSGDEINGYRDLYSRMRSMDFGSQDQWLAGNAPIPQPRKLNKDAPVSANRFRLTNTRADVVFAFYGYNESFAGSAGLARFKDDLGRFIEHTLSQRYNGKTSPRLVLFSPVAHENLGDPNLPDGIENNRRLELYTEAMAEVAKAHGIYFVDLFTPSRDFFRHASREHLTINGIHLNEEGDRVVAGMAYRGLFGEAPAFDGQRLKRLRAAVNAKNWYWFNRYRTPDGYSTYGDRAFLRFVNGQTNYEVVQRELEIIDLLTSNRDKVVWAAAQGKEIKPDDSNLPAFIPVISNLPGPLPGGKHVFLSGEDEIKKMTVHKGMKVNLFASEEQFPELTNPVQMAFDTRGRLWVSAWHTYPHWKPTEAADDKLLIFEDTDGDGRADKCTTFAGDLQNPTGFEFWGGGVIVAQGPDILFLKDTNGDDRYDVKERIIHGMDTADTHHTANSFVLDPGGALYFQEGTFHHTQVETPWGPPRRNANAGVYRYEPRTRKFDVYVTYPFANPHGHVFDRWGQDIVVDGTGAVPYHAPLISSRLDFPKKHRGAPQIYKQRTRPCPGIEILSSRHFPDDMQGNLLVANVIGFQGILCYKVFDKGSSLGATETEPILYSSDRNFRPADLEIGPDGALYFTDWHNPIIGHMQHNLRDPNRDRVHGRVYRVTCIGRPLETPPRIAGEPIEKLLDLLKAPDDRVRSRARIELSGRDTKAVIAAARRWIQNLDHDSDAANRPHHLLEALWLFQSHNVVDTDLLGRVLHSPSDKARAAAVRVCAYWQDRLPNVLDRLGAAADDESPLVRLMAIWAASYVPRPEAAEVVLRAQEHPDDPCFDYLAKEVMRTLGPLVARAEAEHRPIAFKTQAGARYLLKNLSNEQLLQRKADRLALLELLGRPGLTDAQRHETIEAAAQLEKIDESQVVHQALQAIDHGSATADIGVVSDLLKSLKKSKSRDRVLDDYALSARRDILRQLAFASIVNFDASADAAWKLALESRDPSRALQTFVECVPYISDASVRAALYDRIRPLLDGLPQSLGGTRPPREKPNADHTRASAAFTIRRAAMRALTQIRGRETETFRKLAHFVHDGVDRPAAIHSLQSIPRSSWPKEEAGPLTAVLIEQIRRTPVNRRTRPAALDAREFCEALTTLLPPNEAQKVRTQLRELGVRVVKIGTVFERMSYDKDVIAVQAGKPVEFVLENNDLMPHNFVVVEPGALEEIGMFSEAHAQQPGFAARNYVPRSSKVLLSSVLLQPRDSAELSFIAPGRPGVYPFVCTYPGHWRRMYGALYVVGDLDAYLADPEKYVARSKLVPRDALLKDRRPRTEWTIADLSSPVEEMSRSGGRNFGSGKQIFTVANCIACHRLQGVGNSFGPDLTKLDPKWKPADILNEILNPSARINEKFQVNVFELGSGKVVTGLVLEETPETIKIIENPLAKAEPTILQRSDIVDRQRSKTSMMPKGLLDKLTRDEILDLVAYVAAGGSRDRGRFDANPHAHHMHGGSN